MINITLKAKHYRLIAYLLKNIAAYEVFDILSAIKNGVSPTSLDSDEITISIKPENLTYVYPLLSDMKEGEVAEINKEMDYMLRPQIEAGMMNNENEWVYVGTYIYNHKIKYQTKLQNYINQGKDFLNGYN